MMNTLLPLLLACAFAAPAPKDRAVDDAFVELKRLAAQGFQPQRSIKDSGVGLELSATLFHNAKKGLDKLNIYAQFKDRFLLVYTHPGAAERLEFDPVMASDREFPDLLGEKSRTVVYRAVVPGLNKKTLYVLRCAGPRVRRVGAFPEGELRDIDEDGRREVVSRTLALGRFFSVGCEDFQTMAQTAYQTRVLRWKAGRFVDVSDNHSDFFSADIARLEERLPLIPKEKRPGEYLGAALAIYYDYAAKDQRRQGWQRLNALLQPPAAATPHLLSCLDQVRTDLRRSLAIPADW